MSTECCDHEWVTDGINATACSRCGVVGGDYMHHRGLPSRTAALSSSARSEQMDRTVAQVVALTAQVNALTSAVNTLQRVHDGITARLTELETQLALLSQPKPRWHWWF